MDRRSVLKLAAGVAAVDLAAAGQAPAQPSSIQGRGRSDLDYRPVLDRLSAFAQAHLKVYGLPGMTLGVVDADGFAAHFQLGWADVEQRIPVGPDHLFQIGSISKAFASICLFQSLGVQGLERPVAGFLPTIPLPPKPKITVRHLLTHSAGLPDDAPFFPRTPDGKLWYGFAPGSSSSYSNTGYGLAGLIVEQQDRQRDYAASVKARVFDALGMGASIAALRTTDRARYAVGYQPYYNDRGLPRRGRLGAAPWTEFQEASGSIGSTARDMNRYLAWLIAAGRGRGAPLMPDGAATLFTTPQVKAPYFNPEAQYAFGLAVTPVEGRACLHHTGGMVAFSSSFHVDAPAGAGCFASTNASIQDYRPRQITAYAVMLLRALRDGRPLPPPPPVDTGEAIADAADYAGRYVGPGGKDLAIEADAGGLLVRTRGVAGALQRKGKDVFLADHPDLRLALLVFDRPKSGGRPDQVWYGGDAYALDPARAAQALPEGLAAYAGRYDNDDPWRGTVRVFARPDGLYVDGVSPLVKIGPELWRVGAEADGCERVRFDAWVNGRPTRLNVSGVDFLRRWDEA